MYPLGIYSKYQKVGYRQTDALIHQIPSHPPPSQPLIGQTVW